jgi:ABC-type nitrate/sulfonate/bicarbonate transport system substrate-binding protein
MKRIAILMALVFCLSLALTACGGSEAPKPAAKKGDRSESDFSAQGMVKDIEEMQKAAQKGDEVGAFVYGDFGANFYSNGIGAMEEYIKAKPQVARDFVQATMKGVKFTLDKPKEAVAMLKKHQPQLDEDVALQEVEILRNLTMANSIKTIGAMDKDKMVETQDLMVKYLDQKTKLNIDEVYTNEFLA